MSYRFKPLFPWLLGTKPYTLGGIFRARFPTTSEEFITVFKSKNYPILDTRARLYGRAELTIPLSKILSTAVVYQYGDLPPAFLFFGHTISVSLTISGPVDSER